jgi:hypothetical protein
MLPREKVHLVIDDSTIAAGNPADIVEPLRWLSSIYDGPGMYEHSLSQFSQAQRMVRALLLYIYEVDNGGHKQFFSNSSGVVWRDAMEGFKAIGLPRGASILAIAAERLGGDPSLDRGERQEQLEEYQPDFGDLDDASGELQSKVNINEKLMGYIRSRPYDFYFSGMVERVVLPKFR